MWMLSLLPLMTIAALLGLRQLYKRVQQPLRPTLRQSQDPRTAMALGAHWALVRDLDCPHSALLASGPYAVDDTVDLAALGCGPGRCCCHYAPLRAEG